MDKEEARYLLTGYRPNGKDHRDSEMRTALQVLEHDAELKQWFDREQAFDAVIASKLSEEPVPKDLKETIQRGRKMESFSVRWSSPRWYALAAVLILCVGLLISQPFTPPNDEIRLVDFRQEMVQLVRKDFSVSLYTRDPEAIDRWLIQQNLPVAGAAVSQRIQKNKFGCAQVFWKGSPVSVICLEEADGNTAHLFIARVGKPVQDFPHKGETLLASVGDLPTAMWQEEDKAYVLIGNSPQSRITPFL